jgi:hypothetical protein
MPDRGGPEALERSQQVASLWRKSRLLGWQEERRGGMGRFIGFGFWGFLLCVALAGCYGTLRDYSPRSEIEGQVRQSLLEFEQAYNAHDKAMLGRCLHGEPILVAEVAGVFTPGESLDGQVLQAFFSAMEKFPKMSLGEPTIFMTLEPGDRAVLEVISAFGPERLPTKFSMMRDGDRWVIKKVLYY